MRLLRHLLLVLLVSVIAITFAPIVRAAEPAAAPIDIGSRVEMFVDRFLIDRMSDGASLRLTEPQRREIVLTLDQPWEGPTSAYFTVFRDGDLVRMYYRGGSEDYTCYAESRDGGVTFTRPKLGLFEFEGSSANNILFKGKDSASFAPFRDTNPDCKPEQRYKALTYHIIKANKTGLVAYVSPDAIHWSKLQDEPVMIGSGFDSLNVVSWDAIEKKYVCFSRYWDAGEFRGHRAIQSCTSEDFVHWSPMRPNIYAPGVPIEDFYTSAITRCPGAEHLWLAFPKRFVPNRKKIASHPEPGLSDAVFMTSRDGEHWDRTFLEAWLRPGPDERNWTERSTMPAWGIVTRDAEPNEFTMYVSEHYRWPTNRLRRVTVGRHRFASLHAGAKDGEVVTKPFTFAGSTLYLNYSTSAAGSVGAELLDDAGHPIPGFTLAESETIFGDEFDHAVKWKGGALTALVGKPVRLRLILEDADVFAIRFGS